MNELRRHPRIKVDRAVTVTCSDGTVVKARMINLSVDGLAFLYPAPAEMNATLGLKFQLPYNDEVVNVSLRGTVRHTHIRGETYVTGIQFAAVKDDDKSLISRFIDSKLHTIKQY